MKIIYGQLEINSGRPDLNYQKILSVIEKARNQKADILLLPEMCLSGYLVGDLLEQKSFLDDCNYYAQKIIAASYDMCIIFGSIATEYQENGSLRRYNAVFACQHGKLLPGYLGKNFFIKTELANHNQFNDSRYFCSLKELCFENNISLKQALKPLTLTIHGKVISVGILIGEDSTSQNNLPQILVNNNAQILINIASVPFIVKKETKRQALLKKLAQKLSTPILFCNNVGMQNNGKNIFTYAGNSAAYNEQGKTIALAQKFQETLLTIEWTPTNKLVADKNFIEQNSSEIADIYQTLKYCTSKFLAQCQIKKMTIGLSGGIDSAVAAALYADILGADNVLLLNLPSPYNSDTTRTIAQNLARALGANYAIIPITESYKLTVEQLQKTKITNLKTKEEFQLQINDLIKENIQARDRGARIIAAAAAAFGGAFSCNSNKAEISIGYATFYGDIAGALSIIGDLWKHQVYALGHYLNEYVFQKEVIPHEIFTIKPSAELSNSQTVGNGGDPLCYPYHDYLFRAFIEAQEKATPVEILKWYLDDTLASKIGCQKEIIRQNFPTVKIFIDDLERWWKLFFGFAVAKRIQAPPIVTLSERAFGSDNKEAQLSPYFSREYCELKNNILKKNII